MTNPLFTRLSATATRLISAYGREMSLVTITNSFGYPSESLTPSEGLSPSSGTSYNPVQTETTESIYGVETKFDNNDRNDWLIESKDVAILLDSTVEPKPSMRLRDSGVDYSIVNVKRVKPADKSIIYKLQVRL